MFAAGYFGRHYFGAHYFGVGAVPGFGSYFAPNYYARRYFAKRYFGSDPREGIAVLEGADNCAISGVTVITAYFGEIITIEASSAIVDAADNCAISGQNVVGIIGTVEMIEGGDNAAIAGAPAAPTPIDTIWTAQPLTTGVWTKQ